MTREVMQQIDRALKTVSELCDGTRRWTMSVPAQPDHDPDLVIAGALSAARDALREALAQPAQRQPLTDEEILKCFAGSDGTFISSGRAIEAAHGIGDKT